MIPKDKIKEVAESFSQGYALQKYGFKEGAKWAQDELKNITLEFAEYVFDSVFTSNDKPLVSNELFEQFLKGRNENRRQNLIV